MSDLDYIGRGMISRSEGWRVGICVSPELPVSSWDYSYGRIRLIEHLILHCWVRKERWLKVRMGALLCFNLEEVRP